MESNRTMKEQEHDILQSKDLKKMPYTVPEGYFEKLKAEARKTTEPQYVPVGTWTRMAPYAAVAAMFLFIFTLGKIFIREKPAIQGNNVEILSEADELEDYLVFNHDISDVALYLAQEEDSYEISDDEDIVEYLIYIGASEEYVEYNKK